MSPASLHVIHLKRRYYSSWHSQNYNNFFVIKYAECNAIQRISIISYITLKCRYQIMYVVYIVTIQLFMGIMIWLVNKISCIFKMISLLNIDFTVLYIVMGTKQWWFFLIKVFCFFPLCLVYPMLSVSLDCLFYFIVP